MKKRFFRQNLTTFLLPVIIPVLILSGVVYYILTQYVRTEIDNRNLYQIQHAARNIDMFMEDLEKINISLSNNPAVIQQLKSVLSDHGKGILAEDYSAYNAIISLLFSSSGVSESVHSLYIYFNNTDNYFISNIDKLSKLDAFSDSEWYDSYLSHMTDEEKVWSELREIVSSPSLPPTKVLTIYRKIFASAKTLPDGVLVLNVRREDVNKALNTLYDDDSQVVFIADVLKNSVVFQNKDFADTVPGLTGEVMEEIIQNPQDTFLMKIGRELYVVNHTVSEFYEWQYVSVIPESQLYSLLHLLTTILLLLAFLTTAISVGLSYYYANKNYNDIKSIIQIIDNAISGEKLPELPPVAYDVYRYILHNVLKTFLENDYLMVQLSEKKYHIKTLELLALQSQLNPHFLFNTMETLYWKSIALAGGENEITLMIENLSDILRYTLETEESKVLLRKEIKITKSYLSIQSVRYENQFKVTWDYPYNARDIKVPKFILQPIVENCIYHGIRPKGGVIADIIIRVRLANDLLKIDVIDTGVGMTKDELIGLRESLNREDTDQGKHIGLFNTNKRIKLIYGEEYGLKVRSWKDLGTIVSITLSVSKEKDEPADADAKPS